MDAATIASRIIYLIARCNMNGDSDKFEIISFLVNLVLLIVVFIFS